MVLVSRGNITNAQATVPGRLKEFCQREKLRLDTLVLSDYDNAHKVAEKIVDMSRIKPHIVSLMGTELTSEPGRNNRAFAQRAVHSQKDKDGRFLCVEPKDSNGKGTCPDIEDRLAREEVILDVSTLDHMSSCNASAKQRLTHVLSLPTPDICMPWSIDLEWLRQCQGIPQDN